MWMAPDPLLFAPSIHVTFPTLIGCEESDRKWNERETTWTLSFVKGYYRIYMKERVRMTSFYVCAYLLKRTNSWKNPIFNKFHSFYVFFSRTPTQDLVPFTLFMGAARPRCVLASLGLIHSN